MSGQKSNPNFDTMLQMLHTTQEETSKLWDRFLDPPKVPFPGAIQRKRLDSH